MSIKVSIVVPIYKAEAYLPRCIQSILDQTIPDWECILVDDGSPDGCGAICDQAARKGMTAARTAAAQSATRRPARTPAFR